MPDSPQSVSSTKTLDLLTPVEGDERESQTQPETGRGQHSAMQDQSRGGSADAGAARPSVERGERRGLERGRVGRTGRSAEDRPESVQGQVDELLGQSDTSSHGPAFGERDREVYAAHSIVECDGVASTRQIAENMGLSLAAVSARLKGMARRGLVAHVDSFMWDDTADWILTWHGCEAAEAAVPEGIKLARWLDAREHDEYA